MELVLIKQNSIEWDYMWDWVANHPINEKVEVASVALNEGQVWEYMGSFKQGEKMIHSFSHRCHPRHNHPVALHVAASETFDNDQIEKELKMK